MKRSIIKLYDKILVFLLGLTGVLTGCEGPVNEYGTPTAEYELKGTVVDKETKEPIPELRVIRKYYPESEMGDTIYTSRQGEYKFVYVDAPCVDTVYLKVEDADGKDNLGNFETKELNVVFTDDDWEFKNKKGWNKGKLTKIQDIELNKKQEEQNEGNL